MTRTAVGVAVDVVPFGWRDGALHAALVESDSSRWAFPGGRVRAEESLDGAARRWLGEHVSLHDVFLEQLYAFGEPGRDPASRVVSVAYLALLPRPGDARGVRWFPCDALPPLAYDHGAVAEKALERLRAKLTYTNVVFGLLEDPFTLAELQKTYESILGRDLDRRNFRKKLLSLGMVVAIGRRRHGPHPPAELFRFAERRLVAMDV